MSKAVDAGDALSELEQSLMNLNKHVHETGGRQYVQAVPPAAPVAYDRRGYHTALQLVVPEGHEATKVKAMSIASQRIAAMPWVDGTSVQNGIDLKLVKHSARHATLYIKSAHPYAWSAQVEYRECVKPAVEAEKSKITGDRIGWAAEEVAEYYAKLTPAQRATCTALRQRAAAAAVAAPVGEYSAPGEPLRVSLSELVKEAGKPPVRLDDGRWLFSRPGEKHGPNETGAPGPCDVDCRKCQAEQAALRAAAPPDPLDQVIDRQTLRYLLEVDRDMQRRDERPVQFTPTQRAAVSAHWSAQLRAKVEAKRKQDVEAATSVRYCEVEPWE